MDEYVREIFEMEVRLQCRFIIESDRDLAAALAAARDWASDDPEGAAAMQDEAWRQLQMVLVSAANLSKLFWGSGAARPAERKAREADRRPLRERFGVEDDSPLRDTDLRNDFEHFDERLEERAEHDRPLVYVGRHISRTNVIAGPTGDTMPFSHYDPQTGFVSFWTHAVNVPDLVAEAQQILATP